MHADDLVLVGRKPGSSGGVCTTCRRRGKPCLQPHYGRSIRIALAAARRSAEPISSHVSAASSDHLVVDTCFSLVVVTWSSNRKAGTWLGAAHPGTVLLTTRVVETVVEVVQSALDDCSFECPEVDDLKVGRGAQALHFPSNRGRYSKSP